VAQATVLGMLSTFPKPNRAPGRQPAPGPGRVVRRSGFIGPELTPPEDADEQTRMLAFLGRAAWQPVPVWENLTGPLPHRVGQFCGAGS
jgi:hypothetical protein